MRKIKEIIIHCTATLPSATPQSIKKHHIEKNGWKDVGYHFIIDEEGIIWRGRPIEETGAHCIMHNQNSIGIAYIGGLKQNGKTANTINTKQRITILKLVNAIKCIYRITEDNVRMHNEFAAKECPCFSRLKYQTMMQNTQAFENVQLLNWFNL